MFSTREQIENLLEKAHALEEENQREEALSVIQEAVPLAQELHQESGYSEDALLLAEVLYHLGHLYRALERDDQAKGPLQQALRIQTDQSGANVEDRALTLEELGGLYLDAGDADRAEPLLRQALEIAARMDDQLPELAYPMTNLAMALVGQGNLEEAESLYRQALELLGEDHEDAFALVEQMLGALSASVAQQFAEDELEQALRTAQRAFALARERSEEHGFWLAVGLTNLGRLHRELENEEEAEKYLREALELIEGEEEETEQQAELCADLGLLYLQREDATRAEEYLRRAMNLHEEGELGHVQAQVGLACALLLQNRLREAQPLYRAACPRLGPTGSQGDLVVELFVLLGEQSALLMEGGHIEQGYELCEETYRLAQELLTEDNPDRFYATNGLAIYCFATERWEQAEAVTQEALALGEASFVEPAELAVLQKLQGDLHLRRGNHTAAEQQFQLARQLYADAEEEDPEGLSGCLCSLGELALARKEFSTAESLYNEALTYLERDSEDYELSVLELLGQLQSQVEDCYRRRDYQAMRAPAEWAYRLARAHQHWRDPQVVGGFANYAEALRASQTPEDGQQAEPIFRQALELARSILGQDVQTAQILVNLGNLHVQRQDLASAESFYREALAMYREIEGEQGLRYRNLRSELEGLSKTSEQGLDESLPNFPEHLQGTLATLNRQFHGAFQSAPEQAFRLASRSASLARQHREVCDPHLYAVAVGNLGMAQIQAGEVDTGITTLHEAIDFARAHLPPGDPNVPALLASLAAVYQARGNLAAAEPLYQEVVNLHRASTGESRDLAGALAELGVCQEEQGNLTDAEQAMRESLELFRRLAGPEDPSTVASLNWLGQIKGLQGQYEEADALLSEALRYDRISRGDGHFDVGRSLSDLAQYRILAGRHADAASALEEALDIFQQTVGEEHERFTDALFKLAACRQGQQQYDQARSLYQRTLDLRRRTLGSASSEVADVLSRLGGMYHEMGDFPAAFQHFEQAQTLYASALGEDHPEYAQCLINHAQARIDGGDVPGTIALLERALRIRVQAFGRQHPLVEQVRSPLEALRQQL